MNDENASNNAGRKTFAEESKELKNLADENKELKNLANENKELLKLKDQEIKSAHDKIEKLKQDVKYNKNLNMFSKTCFEKEENDLKAKLREKEGQHEELKNQNRKLNELLDKTIKLLEA